MAEERYMPDESDAAICLQCMVDYPVLGPGICYLFGAYRRTGMPQEEARTKAIAVMTAADDVM